MKTYAGTVVALHCSGADGGEWRELGAILGSRAAMVAPGLVGTDAGGPWDGRHAFTLEDEVRPLAARIDAIDGPVQLVGHSYGGAVALRLALSRPGRIASVVLYEPSAFHILRQLGAAAQAETDEIGGVAEEVANGVLCGAFRPAAERFVDYWNGTGAWDAMRPDAQSGILRWLPKAPLDFNALFAEQTPLPAYAAIRCPVAVLRGEHALPPSRRIAEELASAIPGASLEVVAGAGHMGPFTHRTDVARCIMRHIARVRGEREAPDLAA